MKDEPSFDTGHDEKKIEPEKHKWFCDPRSGFLLATCICHFVDPQNGGSLQNDNFCLENQPLTFIRPTLSTPDVSKRDPYNNCPEKAGFLGSAWFSPRISGPWKQNPKPSVSPPKRSNLFLAVRGCCDSSWNTGIHMENHRENTGCNVVKTIINHPPNHHKWVV